jgi:hypothetical protein
LQLNGAPIGKSESWPYLTSKCLQHALLNIQNNIS